MALFIRPLNLFMSSGIFVHGRNDESTIFFDQWKLSKQTSYWFKTGFSFSVKNHNKFSSQNFRHYVHVRKSPDDMNKFKKTTASLLGHHCSSCWFSVCGSDISCGRIWGSLRLIITAKWAPLTCDRYPLWHGTQGRHA